MLVAKSENKKQLLVAKILFSCIKQLLVAKPAFDGNLFISNGSRNKGIKFIGEILCMLMDMYYPYCAFYFKIK